MYDAVGGRFVSRDPLRYDDGMLLYASYMSVNFLDPTGTCRTPCSTWEVIVCGAAATAFGAAYATTSATCALILLPDPTTPAQILGCVLGIPTTILAADKAIEKCEKCSPKTAAAARDAKDRIAQLQARIQELM
jgi:hypothetical protein